MLENPQDNRPDLSLLGLDPSQHPHSLNLAGVDGWPPAPESLANGEPSMTPAIAPDYGLPDMTPPPLRPYDLQQPGITHFPEFTPDPDMPDLESYNKPYALDIRDGMTPSPVIAADIPSEAEIAASLYPGLGFPMLNVSHDVRDPDPPLPDLQSPMLTPQVEMRPEDRPGNMDAGALDVLNADAHFQQTDDKDYPSSQMDARGMNSTRARHMALLTGGLDDD